MRLADWIAWQMVVLMVFVMHMQMLMFHRLMNMRVLVFLGDVCNHTPINIKRPDAHNIPSICPWAR